jgi:hypothetical protein
MGRAKGQISAVATEGFSSALGSRRGSNRKDKPQKLVYKKYVNTDNQEVEEYRAWEGGPLHNPDGPAVTSTSLDDGTKIEDCFWMDERHREDGPAIIITGLDGSNTHEYYIHGKRHREKAPAIIITTALGAKHEEYYEDGKYITLNFSKPAASTVMYHVAPAERSAGIEKHGIDFRKSSETYRSLRAPFESKKDMWMYPAGNFVTSSLERVQEISNRNRGSHIIYEVETSGLDLIPDPDTGWAGVSYYTKKAIEPSRLKRLSG